VTAETAGFCFGVERAVTMCEQLLARGERAASLGEIIHNPDVVKGLSERGLQPVRSLGEVGPGEKLVIRSHGAAQSVFDECAARGIETVDATCPFVRKIHELAARYSKTGYTVLIAGDRNHPEVQGILGHCHGKALVFGSPEELSALKDAPKSDDPVILLSQTTFHAELFTYCVKDVKSRYTNVLIFDTICSATQTRQLEAEKLAQNCDVCIVIGGKNSSNTGKLFEVCSKHARTFRIETARELDGGMWEGAKKIGITAGASTPSAIIQEVKRKMSDMIKEEEFNFEEALEESLKLVHRNQRVEGVVTSIHPNEVVVDIGTKQTGFVPIDELSDDSSANPEDLVKVGDKLHLVVTAVHDNEGFVTLSKKRVDSEAGLNELTKGFEEGTVFECYITEAVNKGLIAMVKGVRVFIPASQATLRRGEQYEQLARTKQRIKILEVNPERRRAIGSIRAVAEAERAKLRETFWQNIEIGKRYSGTVRSITTYGAFVDLGGIDGMVHKSELSWERVNRLEDYVHVGDVIDVYVKDFNPETQKISLGYRSEEDNPWNVIRTYPIGMEFDAPVVSITSFGAFVRILPGIDGLVHTSELSSGPVRNPADVVKVGDTVHVRLIGADIEKRRISLSMRPQSEADLQ